MGQSHENFIKSRPSRDTSLGQNYGNDEKLNRIPFDAPRSAVIRRGTVMSINGGREQTNALDGYD